MVANVMNKIKISDGTILKTLGVTTSFMGTSAMHRDSTLPILGSFLYSSGGSNHRVVRVNNDGTITIFENSYAYDSIAVSKKGDIVAVQITSTAGDWRVYRVADSISILFTMPIGVLYNGPIIMTQDMNRSMGYLGMDSFFKYQ